MRAAGLYVSACEGTVMARWIDANPPIQVSWIPVELGTTVDDGRDEIQSVLVCWCRTARDKALDGELGECMSPLHACGNSSARSHAGFQLALSRKESFLGLLHPSARRFPGV
jgi:hypothetical protein